MILAGAGKEATSGSAGPLARERGQYLRLSLLFPIISKLAIIDAVANKKPGFQEKGLDMLKKLERILLLLVMFVAMAAIPISTAWSGQSNCILQFEGDLFSANVSSARLIDVLEELKKNKGIWFKGNPVMLETEVSAQFENLPLEAGIRKILARINHRLVFDKNQHLEGLSILGKSDAVPGHLEPQEQPQTSKEPPTLRESPTAKLPIVPRGSEAGVDKEMFKVIPNMAPPDNPDAKPIDMTVIMNSPPPGNPKAEPIDMTVIENSPPPGVPQPGADLPKTPDRALKRQ